MADAMQSSAILIKAFQDFRKKSLLSHAVECSTDTLQKNFGHGSVRQRTRIAEGNLSRKRYTTAPRKKRSTGNSKAIPHFNGISSDFAILERTAGVNAA
jgi:hypothetical protein